MDIDAERRKLRFMGKFKVIEETGCWEWQCGKIYKPNGNYGMFFWGMVDGKEKSVQAHRAAWLILRGPVPKDGILCHKCNYPTCVNPDHIYIGTHKTNAADRVGAGTQRRMEDVYNFKRNSDLIAKIIAEFNTGKQAKEVCDAMGIGWTTLYRARAQSAELKAVMAATKSARYSVGGRKAYQNRKH